MFMDVYGSTAPTRVIGSAVTLVPSSLTTAKLTTQTLSRGVDPKPGFSSGVLVTQNKKTRGLPRVQCFLRDPPKRETGSDMGPSLLA